jgi:hypothetical protein
MLHFIPRNCFISLNHHLCFSPPATSIVLFTFHCGIAHPIWFVPPITILLQYLAFRFLSK